MYKIMERHLIKKQQSNLKAAHLALSYRRIIDELRTDPFRPTHHFEILEKRKPRPSLYSKRLSRSNRIVYTVDPQKQVITIFSAWGHYASGNQSLIHHRL